jgi:hypothetical protein
MTLQDFNSRYEYVRDMEQWEVDDLWEIMELKDGKYFGDCESYVLTLIAKVEDFKDLKPWYCKYTFPDGTSLAHCIGISGDLAIDCNTKAFISFNKLKEQQGWQEYRPMGTFEVWWNIQKSKLFKVTYKHFPKVAVSVTNFLK